MTKWNAGGICLPEGPFMIGAGVCKTPTSTAEWLKVAPVVSGSYTKEPRAGNPGPVMWPETLEEVLRHGYALNAYGMPNMGCVEAARSFMEMGNKKPSPDETRHPLIISIAGFSIEDFVTALVVFNNFSVGKAFELNFGCPNTQGEHSEIISFCPEFIDHLLSIVARQKHLTDKPIWLKFSPYCNPAELKRMAAMVNRFAETMRVAVVTCNTLPNAYAGEGRIGPNGGLAGLSGPAMKLVALGQVKMFRENLDPNIDVIGVGGVMTGDDIVDLLDAGASAVQITSLAHWAGSPRSFFDHLLKEETAGRFLELINES